MLSFQYVDINNLVKNLSLKSFNNWSLLVVTGVLVTNVTSLNIDVNITIKSNKYQKNLLKNHSVFVSLKCLLEYYGLITNFSILIFFTKTLSNL